jgi:hypothetical protein
MAISLTKEEFVKRIQERNDELSFPIEKMKADGVGERIFSQNERGTNINLSEVMGYYVSHLLDVLYRE